jgi:putative ABC transport system permease protein
LGQASFKNPIDGSERTIFAVGFNPRSALLNMPGIAENLEKIRNPGVVLFDSIRRPEFGPIAEDVQKLGQVITEIGGRQVEIDGLFQMGTSFAIDGTVVMSDETFLQVLPYRSRGIIDVGLIRLKPGVSAERTKAEIDRLLPNDVRVLTHAEFVELERHYWATFTPTGFIFKLGVRNIPRRRAQWPACSKRSLSNSP